MPVYLFKITNDKGWVKPPVVANCPDQAAALQLVRALGDERDTIEAKGFLPDTMKADFGDVTSGSALFRFDWIWSDDDKPKKY